MGGDHRGDDGVGDEGSRRVGSRRGPQPGERARSGERLATRQVVVRDIGQLRENGEPADQQQGVAQRQPLQAISQTRIGLAAPVRAHGPDPDLLDLVEGGEPLLLTDDIAEQSPEQAYDPARRGGVRTIGGCRLIHRVAPRWPQSMTTYASPCPQRRGIRIPCDRFMSIAPFEAPIGAAGRPAVSPGLLAWGRSASPQGRPA